MTPPPMPSSTPAPKSTFVTVVAWVFIVQSGLATFISVLQNVMIGFMRRAFVNGPMQDTGFDAIVPSGARFVFAHIQLLVLLLFLVCLATLVSSIGLLGRRNWARLAFIGLLGFGIVYIVAALFLQQSMISAFHNSIPIGSMFAADSTFRQTGQQMAQMLVVMSISMFVLAVGLAVVFAWIIAKLVSPPIREEFLSVERAA
jgi:hypothetical protein